MGSLSHLVQHHTHDRGGAADYDGPLLLGGLFTCPGLHHPFCDNLDIVLQFPLPSSRLGVETSNILRAASI